jgi:hypothetical protein
VIPRLARGALAEGALFLGAAPAGAATRSAHLPLLSDTLLVEPWSGVACLRHPFVFRASLELYLEERLLIEGAEFHLDPDAGCLSLLIPDTLGVGRTLVARYQALPLALEGTYRLREDPHQHGALPNPPWKPKERTSLGFRQPILAELDISGDPGGGMGTGATSSVKPR